MSRKAKQPVWTASLLKKGFEKFMVENGHYPSALEVDSCPYLCTSRLIQFKFGGLLNLRGLMGLSEVSYAVGEYRKNTWAKADEISLVSEREIGDFLIGRYGEICVHEEKKYGDGRSRVDFFIYAKEHFAVEVFNTYTLHGLAGNLNSKLRKYGDFSYRLFFVVTGGEFSQAQIDRVVYRKRKLVLKDNMKCVGVKAFKDECINSLPPLKLPASIGHIGSRNQRQLFR